jgi:ABC-type amino acid transport substrate-binding protein
MRIALAVVVGVALAGCASTKANTSQEPSAVQAEPLAPAEAEAPASSQEDPSRYVDAERRFEIHRPDGSWNFRDGRELSTESIEVPVVVANAAQGAQVVVQVAPAVATTTQFAERLTLGLRTRAGFATTEIEPIPLADGAVGFDFDVADQVHGRVAILEGGGGQVYVLLATWPQGAPATLERDIDHILNSMKPSELP